MSIFPLKEGQRVDFLINEFMWGFFCCDIHDLDWCWQLGYGNRDWHWYTRVAWRLFISAATILRWITKLSLPKSADEILKDIIDTQDVESAKYFVKIIPMGMWRFRLNDLLSHEIKDE